MLKRILMIAGRGGAMSIDVLSDELGVDSGMVSQMIGDLCRRDYLRMVPVASICSGGCGSCSRNKSCGKVPGKGIAWRLTGKGQQAVAGMPYA